jgi:beta-lactamase regulating signal transducer with metallopeptidase domain
VWRKELENNLEFYTDNKLLRRDEVEKESYQLSLLKVAAPHFPLALTTNYNQSLLKKRLLMMNAKKSNVHTAWKYFFLLPLMVLLYACLMSLLLKVKTSFKRNGKSMEHANHDIKTEGN